MSGFIEQKPVSWETLKRYHLNPPQTADELRRKKIIQMSYNLKRKMILSYCDYLLKTIFSVETEEESIFRGYRITENLFPYNIEEGISHMIFWIYPGRTFSEREIIAIIERVYPNRGYVLFKHRENVRSNIGIEHYQLFIKK